MKAQREIRRYNLVLRPAKTTDIERMRRWRNAPHVRKAMKFQAYISPEMQVEWWNSLNPFHNFYYVLQCEGEEVGILHAKEIDWGKGCAEMGIFVGNRNYLGHFGPILAILALMEEMFEFHQVNYLLASIRADQPEILKMNLQLGYQIIAQNDNSIQLKTNRQQFETATQTLRKFASKFEGRTK